MSNNILHIMVIDKFIPSFIKFDEENFDDFSSNHCFIVIGENEKFPLIKKNNIILIKRLGISNLFELILLMNKYDKVILHGLFNTRINQVLIFQPWILKKCYWAMWGGDLYAHTKPQKKMGDKINEIIRKIIIKKFGHLISYVDGDIELARKWYKAKGIHHDCIMYTSNVYEEPVELFDSNSSIINIQIGNSADPSNNHVEIIEMLHKHRGDNIAIYAPLSYGDKTYAQNLIAIGKEKFGEKFHPITELMPAHDYLKFLQKIDIAIFNHNRQQAMGNTITLLGLGKKVYLRKNISSWNSIKKIGATAFDIEKFSLTPIDNITKEKNKIVIKQNFSNENLKKQLKLIFDY